MAFPSYSSGPFGQSLSTPKRDLIPMSFSGPSLTSPAVDPMDIDARIASSLNAIRQRSLVWQMNNRDPNQVLPRSNNQRLHHIRNRLLAEFPALHLAAVEEKAQEGSGSSRRWSTKRFPYTSLQAFFAERGRALPSRVRDLVPYQARPGGKAKSKTAPNLVATIFSRPPPMTDEVSLIFADHDRRLAEREQLTKMATQVLTFMVTPLMMKKMNGLYT
jgi:hypothetical protein